MLKIGQEDALDGALVNTGKLTYEGSLLRSKRDELKPELEARSKLKEDIE